MKNVAGYLRDLLEQIGDIEAFTTAGRDAFFKDRKTQKAVIRSYEIIGEIVKRLPSDLLTPYLDVEWQRIKAFRDFLIHNYDRVAPALVWEAVEKLPILKSAVADLLAQHTPDDSEHSETADE
ncbi:MAG: DUF86 domain-containing protein [Anaerolineae bacterium]|nr:DUF86 domain-containing protein [Chloroflexota bacterium]MBN8640085.1 DUF86 domain-containing protein [Anaerolineae bacterium]